jgi:hypothetical protein
MNKKAFRKMIERYPKRHLLKDYTEEDLMFMIQRYRASEVKTIGINFSDIYPAKKPNESFNKSKSFDKKTK